MTGTRAAMCMKTASTGMMPMSPSSQNQVETAPTCSSTGWKRPTIEPVMVIIENARQNEVNDDIVRRRRWL